MTMDVGDWLRSLGLGKYEATFRDSEIDSDILDELTESDLEKLGLPLGPRKRLLKAIAGLGAAASAPSTATLREADAAERRHLTVMFIDLVGSTALSAKLDPEDLGSVIGGYQRCCADLVERNGGFVARYVGDGVLAYFGYPRAHEHDAERAVRAGLDLVEAVPKLNSAAGSPLKVRVGIATGLVVVGDLIGNGGAQEHNAIVGDTPNLAARLQGLAEPNTVVIAEGTRKLLASLFELEDLGIKDLKGIGPTRAFAALRVSSAESRFEALHTAGLTPLIGREEELQLLLRRWSQAKTGEGQVVLLSGEAGIGKSRLVAAFLERVAPEPHKRVRYFCSPQHTDSALYPIVGQIERAAGMAHDDKPKARLDKLDALLAQTSTSIQDAALFAEMMSLPNDGRYPALELTPQQGRQRTLEAMTAQLAALVRQNPVLMIVEDAHWIDPTSLEVFGRTVDQIKTLAALLIVTFRPEFNAPWVEQSHVTSVMLNRLGQREAASIIARLVGNKELSADVMAEIVERTDGIPLFVEELTKAVLEAESEGDGRRIVTAVPSPGLAVPGSLHASLMARLDRLGPAKELAQIGAAIGREFSHALLALLVRKPEAELGSALDRLIAAGLLFRQGVPPYARYLFKHALVQDVAYSSLLRSKRQQLHAEIAGLLESQFPDTVNSSPGLISHHYKSAGKFDRAIPYSIRAGDVAASRYASAEATVHYQAAFDMARELQASDDADNARVQAVLKLASVATRREHFERDLRNLEGVRQLAESGANREQLCRILYWTGRMHFVLGNFDRGVEYAQQALRLAEEIGGGDDLTAEPINLLARIHCLRGEPAPAVQYAARNVGQMHRLGNRVEEAAVSGVLAFACGMSGRYRDALNAAEQGVLLARGLDHLPTLAACYMYRAVVEGWFGHIQDALSHFEQAQTISERAGDLFRRYLVHGWRGEAYMLSGDYAAAGKELSQCIVLGDQIGTSFHRGAFLAFVARVRLHEGDVAGAQRAIEEAMHVAVETRQPWGQSIALRVQSEIWLSALPQQLDAAEAAVRQAIDVQVTRECHCDLAWSRLVLGRVLHAKGNSAGAIAELIEAKREFEKLGIARGIETVSAAFKIASESAHVALAQSARDALPGQVTD
jgi:class 3 adenylate cyclase/tetratricopeptide (TPR) repeat protein